MAKRRRSRCSCGVGDARTPVKGHQQQMRFALTSAHDAFKQTDWPKMSSRLRIAAQHADELDWHERRGEDTAFGGLGDQERPAGQHHRLMQGALEDAPDYRKRGDWWWYSKLLKSASEQAAHLDWHARHGDKIPWKGLGAPAVRCHCRPRTR